MKRFFILLFLFALGMAAGFSSHNYYIWNKQQDEANNAVRIVTKKLHDVPVLPYRRLDQPVYQTEEFPLPDQGFYSGNSITQKEQEELPGQEVQTTEAEPASDGLEYRVNQAIRESNIDYEADSGNVETDYTIFDLPSDVQAKIPHFNYASHVYSSNTRDRFITLNDRRYREGDKPFGVLKVLKIAPGYTVFRVGTTTFSLSSLVDWKGGSSRPSRASRN
ncbi:MAG: general secretion pathway protein GspB [Succinivibrionaceae bacterium]|nr:general secretion pathway protein GspB [Succinivibrionaceae bacterium]